MTYHVVPRVTSPYPMGLLLHGPAPRRMRDDLDPHDPPAEYADGHLSWSGHDSREARDQARERAREADARAAVAQRHRADIARARVEDETRAQIRRALRTCQHLHATTDDAVHCFTGPVARDENRAAHGGVVVTDRCRQCGAMRARNVNQQYEEIGPWGVDADRVYDAGERIWYAIMREEPQR